MSEEPEVAARSKELQARLDRLEERLGERDATVGAARETLEKLRRLRRRGGRRTWAGEQRAALRFVIVSVGCVAVVTGGWALSPTIGGAAIAGALGVLMFEGLR